MIKTRFITLAGITLLVTSCSLGGSDAYKLIEELESNGANCSSPYSIDLREVFGLDFSEAASEGVGATAATISDCSFDSQWFGKRDYTLLVADKASDLKKVVGYVCDSYDSAELSGQNPFLSGPNWLIYGSSYQPERKVMQLFSSLIGGEVKTDLCL
jgi:hypothetical protein